MERLEKIRNMLTQWSLWIGSAALVIMTAIACANMILRPTGYPLKGAYELVGFLGAMTICFALGYTQVTRSHIAVDVMASRYSKRTKQIVTGMNSFVGTLFFLLVAWRVAIYGNTIRARGEISETLKIIYHPFIYAIALCCGLLAFTLFMDLLKSLRPQKEKDR